MFDKLVESASTGAELRPRRRIFAASFFFVAMLFATAVLASIYAADFDLGNDNFDLAQLLTPIAETEPPAEPEPVREETQASSAQNSSEPTRRVIMTSTDDPSRVPTEPSTAVNPYRSTSPDRYSSMRTGIADADPGYTGRPATEGNSSRPTGNSASELGTETLPKEPPPVVKKAEKKPPTQTLGVVNGRASFLPKPPFPALARNVGAFGAVNVQVTIDETGNVISAKAVSGHLMLRQAAEDAARRAKFTTTTLSNVPVKVTGVIVYNFTKN